MNLKRLRRVFSGFNGSETYPPSARYPFRESTFDLLFLVARIVLNSSDKTPGSRRRNNEKVALRDRKNVARAVSAERPVWFTDNPENRYHSVNSEFKCAIWFNFNDYRQTYSG
jgi:hypothetical protein